ncbi:hypothetical protein PMAYCL1PPCAC_10283 [Pristionchus mayeri]|uniref:Sushi domain-containing protein n=1 Tax=Pristionchus mayeri TaxID=1317129 RepID=A0AAN4ZF50_9BILA|nr:hypothetical protein PMAYCL1PPCAC_10283 [Pristionchus mayeri]
MDPRPLTIFWNKETPKLICERYYSPTELAKLEPAGGAVECGCSYKFSPCPTCDPEQMFVLDGFGASSKRCSLGCAKGYVFEGGETNLISCKAGTWIGTSRTNMTTVPVPAPYGYIRTGCVPETTAPVCSAPAYNSLFSCDGCDRTKLVRQSSTKGGCVLKCDKGFRLVLIKKTTREVTRAQEAVFQQNQWLIYPLGEVVDPPVPMSSSDAQFSCEPATPHIPQTSTTTGPVCGCSYALKQCLACDNGQMIGGHDGAGTCRLSCGPGYQLQLNGSAVDNGFISAATCANYKWFGRYASFGSTFTLAIAPAFACVRVASAKCTATYSPLSACTTCDSTKLQRLSTLKQCQLGCTTGFRLVAHTANSLDGAKRFSELIAVFSQGGTSRRR